MKMSLVTEATMADSDGTLRCVSTLDMEERNT